MKKLLAVFGGLVVVAAIVCGALWYWTDVFDGVVTIGSGDTAEYQQRIEDLENQREEYRNQIADRDQAILDYQNQRNHYRDQLASIVAPPFTAALDGTWEIVTTTAPTPTTTPLFNLDGIINVGQATNILNALNTNNTAVTNTETAFRLFPSVGSNYTRTLSQLNWRVVHVDGDRVTLLASESYRASVFNSGAPRTHYRYSVARENLLNDWGALVAELGIEQYIKPQGTTTDGANADDLIWLPSEAELRNDGYWGKTTNSQRTFTPLTIGHGAWTRTHSFADHIRGLNSLGAFFDIVVISTQMEIRPALHISLSSLLEAVASDSPPNPTFTITNGMGVPMGAGTSLVAFEQGIILMSENPVQPESLPTSMPMFYNAELGTLSNPHMPTFYFIRVGVGYA